MCIFEKMHLMGPLNSLLSSPLDIISSTGTACTLPIWCISSSRLYYYSSLQWVFDHVIWVTVPHPHLGSHKLAPRPVPSRNMLSAACVCDTKGMNYTGGGVHISVQYAAVPKCFVSGPTLVRIHTVAPANWNVLPIFPWAAQSEI